MSALERIDNIPWEDKKNDCTDVLWRYSQNPIIRRDAIKRSNSIFNSAVVPFNFRRRIPVNEEFSAHLDRLEKVSEDDERKIVTVPPFTMNWKGKRTIGTLALANVFSESAMDTTPGVVRVTDNPLDLLIDGPGFFAVQDGAGNTFYTRQGSFALSDDGVIVTQ